VDGKEETMKFRPTSIAAGVTLALGAVIPAAQAATSSYHDPAGAYVVASKVTPVHLVTPKKKPHHTITVSVGAASKTIAPATLPVLDPSGFDCTYIICSPVSIGFSVGAIAQPADGTGDPAVPQEPQPSQFCEDNSYMC
jgi:hypothetical protein